MMFFFIISGILAGVLFPAFLIKAIRSEEKDKSENYTVLTCIISGYILFFLFKVFTY